MKDLILRGYLSKSKLLCDDLKILLYNMIFHIEVK